MARYRRVASAQGTVFAEPAYPRASGWQIVKSRSFRTVLLLVLVLVLGLISVSVWFNAGRFLPYSLSPSKHPPPSPADDSPRPPLGRPDDDPATAPAGAFPADGLFSPDSPPTLAPIVHAKAGSVLGLYNNFYDQDFFLGVPYAQPPVGKLRFRRPQPLPRSRAIIDAQEFAKACIGYGMDSQHTHQSEDCLYLNIVRPALRDKAGRVSRKRKLPVAVYIHGGAFTMGAGSGARNNLSFTVANSVRMDTPIIGITINYRLSAWGFLSGIEPFQSGETNNGLRDQRMALEWIHKNIEYFGGDPEKVTIWGESAGAASVGFHITAFNGRDDGLFRAGIMQSGSPVLYLPLKTWEDMDPHFQKILNATGCQNAGDIAGDKISCMSVAPFDKVQAAIVASEPRIWMPIVDREVIHEHTSELLKSGNYVKVPVVVGANTDEGTMFTPHEVADESQFKALLLSSTGGKRIDDLLAAYPDDECFGSPEAYGCDRPGAPFGAQYRRAARFVGDQLFVANRRHTCATWAAAGVPAYCYRFNAVPAHSRREYGVAHARDLPFVFANIMGEGYVGDPPFDDKDQANIELATNMNRAWIAFVATLDPNNWLIGHTEAWPRYDTAEPRELVFEPDNVHVEADDYRAKALDIIVSNYAADGR